MRPDTQAIVEYDLLFDCVHCGLCLEACPTYLQTRAEMDSPRGRIYLMKAIAEGGLELDADSVRHLDLCLGCRGCETACPSGVRYGELIEQARDFVENRAERPLNQRLRRFLVNLVFPFPWRLRAALMPIRIADKIGIRGALRAILPASLQKWLDLLPQLERTKRKPSSRRADEHAVSGPAQSVSLHRGCVARVLADSTNDAIEDVLGAAGFRLVQIDKAQCCGALDLHAGNRARAIRFAQANVRAMRQSGAASIVSAASGCATAIAGYGDLLKNDPELAAAAREVSRCVRDLSTLLLSRGFTIGAGFTCRVTYHDACHLAHGLGVRDAPRQLLRSIPGVELIELVESDLCCGSAGTYNLTQPEMAGQLAERKVKNIIETGAEYVVMANPGCQFQIAAELRRRGSAIKAIHLADFLALKLGGAAKNARA
jgi:glycolate oxidase iron-sulfur subunit